MDGYERGRPGEDVILVNAEPVDALSMLVHRARPRAAAARMCERLKDLIPRHMFKIAIQAAIGGKSSRARPSAPCART
jgi:GTP-binding protein LepA